MNYLINIIVLISSYKCAVYIPFKILENEINDNNFFNSSCVIKYWKEPKIYSELLIGNPPQKIGVFFTSDIYELNLFQNMCDIPNSFYNQKESLTYKYITNINYVYNNQINCSIINESLHLFTDEAQTKKLNIENFNIIYSENKKEEFKENYFIKKKFEYHPNTCLSIGFKPSQSIGFGYDLNFVGQIKHYKKNNIPSINGYDWTFKFNSDKEGFLIIGEKPHEFDNKNFKEEQFLSQGSKNRFYTSEWFLEFNSIFYNGIRQNNNSIYNSSFYSDTTVKFDLDLGSIEGTDNYEKSIKKDFFDSLIEKKICFVEEVDLEYRIYYCDKKLSSDYIEKYFPVLKFCMKQFEMCFDFNYKDLFREKNEKLYFLVYFNLKNKNSYRFIIGQILIKKYLLTFNYDTKMIGFYNKNIKIELKKEKKHYYEHDNKVYIIFIISLIIFLIVGFLLGKKIYESTRKKKANELIDDYEYESNDIREIKSNNSLSIEMKSKYGII